MKQRKKAKENSLIYPSAVAVWLVDNTSLTFKQIADACGLHILQVQAMADGEVANGIVGFNPVASSEITKEEIERCTLDPSRTPKVAFLNNKNSSKTVKKQQNVVGGALSAKRRAKPDAILWLLNNHPQLSVSDIIKLIGTTAKIVESILDGTYWNMEHLRPREPVMLHLCTQEELDEVLLKVKISNESDVNSDKVQNILNKIPTTNYFVDENNE